MDDILDAWDAEWANVNSIFADPRNAYLDIDYWVEMGEGLDKSGGPC